MQCLLVFLSCLSGTSFNILQLQMCQQEQESDRQVYFIQKIRLMLFFLQFCNVWLQLDDMFFVAQTLGLEIMHSSLIASFYRCKLLIIHGILFKKFLCQFHTGLLFSDKNVVLIWSNFFIFLAPLRQRLRWRLQDRQAPSSVTARQLFQMTTENVCVFALKQLNRLKLNYIFKWLGLGELKLVEMLPVC